MARRYQPRPLMYAEGVHNLVGVGVNPTTAIEVVSEKYWIDKSNVRKACKRYKEVLEELDRRRETAVTTGRADEITFEALVTEKHGYTPGQADTPNPKELPARKKPTAEQIEEAFNQLFIP